MRVFVFTFMMLLLLGCTSRASDSRAQAIVQEASEASASGQGRIASGRGFHSNVVGFWRTKTFQQGAWVDLIWVMGRTHAWHVVTAYADEDLTIPLLRWDIIRRYRLLGPSPSRPDTFDMVWTDVTSRLTAFVDNPALFASVGIDDCSLQVDVPIDLAVDNCGAPLFPFRDCQLMDFVNVNNGVMTFGDPTQTDRCLERPTRDEVWSFLSVPYDGQLHDALFPTPWQL